MKQEKNEIRNFEKKLANEDIERSGKADIQ